MIRRFVLSAAAAAALAALLLLGVADGTASAATAGTAPSASGAGRGVAPGRVDTAQKVSDTIAAGRLLFVGASYTVGWGATQPGADYAALVASRLHRQLTIDAVAGTGFTNPGRRDQGTFGQRIARLPSSIDPRIVIIQGGRDDLAPPPVEYDAVVHTVQETRSRFVHAQVVILGPVPATVPVYRSLLATRAAIARAARASGAGFIDPIAQNWITRVNERRYTGRIPGHPNDAGYAYIAGRLLADLPTALQASATPVDPSDDPDSPAARAAQRTDTPPPARRTAPRPYTSFEFDVRV